MMPIYDFSDVINHTRMLEALDESTLKAMKDLWKFSFPKFLYYLLYRDSDMDVKEISIRDI